MSRVRQLGNVSPIKDEEPQPSVSISKSTISASLMGIADVVAGIGAGTAWGIGQGLLAAAIGLFITGVLLGIG